MTSQSIPAVLWDDSATQSRRRQHTAERYAENVEAPTWAPACSARDDLVRKLREAARLEAEAWDEFARWSRDCFESAFTAEQADRRRRYDTLPNTVEGAPGDRAGQVSRSYDDSYARLHQAGRCRSLFCCGEQDAVS